MEQNYFCLLYDTDIWGSNDSRADLGLFSSVENALYSLLRDDNFETTAYMKTRLKGYFNNNARLFVDACEVDVFEGFSQSFDSEQQASKDMLKRMIFFEVVKRYEGELNLVFQRFIEKEIIHTDHVQDFAKIENYDDLIDNSQFEDCMEEYADCLFFIKML